MTWIETIENKEYMTHDEFQILLYKIPFLTNIIEFIPFHKELLTKLHYMTVRQKTDYYFTLVENGRRYLSLEYLHILIIKEPTILEDTYKNFGELSTIDYAKNMVMDAAVNLNTNDFQCIIPLVDKLLPFITNEIDLLEFCFVSIDYFKPLFTGLKTVKRVDRKLLYYFTDLCLNKCIIAENKLKCLLKLVHQRPLHDHEKTFLLTMLDTEWSGHVIDILLACDDVTCLEKAHEHIKEVASQDEFPYNADNNVHYLSLSNEAILDITEHANNENIVDTLRKMSDLRYIIATSSKDIKNFDAFVRLVLLSGYKYMQCITIERIIDWAYNKCNDEEKIDFIKTICILDETVCAYGLILNVVMFLFGLNKGDFIEERKNSKNDDILAELKLKYDENDDFWTDPVKINEALSIGLTKAN